MSNYLLVVLAGMGGG